MRKILAGLLLVIMGNALMAQESVITTFILIRHAEKILHKAPTTPIYHRKVRFAQRDWWMY